jgi:polysaccharide biosynthesis protein PslG
LLVTELSWTSGKGRATFTYGWETTESGQASRVRSALRRLAAARGRFRLAGVYWYTWLSPRIGGRDSFSYSGLRRLNAAGRPVSKPALAAFRGVARALAR